MRPISDLWMFGTNRHLDYPRCKTKHCWRSIDAHIQDRAGSLSLSFLHLEAASTSFMDNCNNCHWRYPRCKAKHHWHPMDTNFQNAAVTVTLGLLRIKTTNTMVMHNSDQITVQLPYLQDQISLTLRGSSFECIFHSQSAAIDNWIRNCLTFLVAFLPYRATTLWPSLA